MKKTLTLVCCMLLCMSCRGLREAPRTIALCPPPPDPSCLAQKSVVSFDTSSNSSSVTYYCIRPVRGLSTQIDEWSMCFVSTTNVLATIKSANQMTLVSGTAVEVDSATTSTEIPSTVAGGRGLASIGSTRFISMYPVDNKSGDADIYSVRIEKDRLEGVQRFAAVSLDTCWDSHPALSPNGKVLFFASNRDGGFGGTDIWYVTKNQDGSWSSPINAGDKVNTACDDLCPFVTQDSKLLLFSSSGHDTFGGYDLFLSDIAPSFFNGSAGSRNQQHFSVARNFGAPLNTSSDELFASSPGDINDRLYYSSNQNTRNGFDMYVRYRRATKRDPSKPPVVTKAEPEVPTTVTKSDKPDSIVIKGKVFTNNKKIVVRGDVKARDLKTNTTVDETTTNDSGDYELKIPADREMEVVAQYDGGFFDSFRVKRAMNDSTTVVQHDFVVPEVLFLRVNFPTDKYLDPYENVLDSNGIETNQKWNESIDLVSDNLKKFSKSLKQVLLVGHTDENGTNEYNFALGQRRVQFVIDELVKRGLARQLFQARSAGEMEPLPRRKDEPLEDYYKRNRRVEITKITK